MDSLFQTELLLLQTLESELADHLPPAAAERGWDYYSKGRVQTVKLMDGDTLIGAVRGTDMYSVMLDASHFAYSTCTCPNSEYCKHMAAVYFAACAKSGTRSPEEARRRLMGLAAPEASAAGGRTAEMTEDDHRRIASRMEELYGEAWKQCRYSLHPLQSVLLGLKGLARDWDKSIQKYEWMLAILFTLRQAEKAFTLVDPFSKYYQQMSFTRMAEPWIEQYESIAAEQPNWREWTARSSEWFDIVAEYARNQACDGGNELFRWDFLYLSLTSGRLDDDKWRAAERARLERKSADTAVQNAQSAPSTSSTKPAAAGASTEALQTAAQQSKRRNYFAEIGLAALDMFEGRDARAAARLEEAPIEPIEPLIQMYAQTRLAERNWDSFAIWMKFFFERRSTGGNSRAMGPFLYLCRQADLAQPDNPTWTNWMISLLPYSYSELADHWLELGKFEQWADLQLLMGLSPEDLDGKDMREAAKSAPQALLPIYHQAIDDAIGARNRQGYKTAVKLMKKLEKLYKTLKQQEQWDRYVALVSDKYHRLRALQEEMAKGNIRA